MDKSCYFFAALYKKNYLFSVCNFFNKVTKLSQNLKYYNKNTLFKFLFCFYN